MARQERNGAGSISQACSGRNGWERNRIGMAWKRTTRGNREMERDFVNVRGIRLNAEIDAAEVGKELNKLGSFTTEALVKVASNKKSPLNKYFEWDDSIAAHAYRLGQARNLVLAIGFDKQGEFTRAFESVVIDNHRLYVPMAQIEQSPELIDQVLSSILGELTFWRDKHQKYKHIFGGVFDAINKAEETYRSSSEKGKESKRGTRRNKVRNSSNKKTNSKYNDNRRQSSSR